MEKIQFQKTILFYKLMMIMCVYFFFFLFNLPFSIGFNKEFFYQIFL